MNIADQLYGANLERYEQELASSSEYKKLLDGYCKQIEGLAIEAGQITAIYDSIAEFVGYCTRYYYMQGAVAGVGIQVIAHEGKP